MTEIRVTIDREYGDDFWQIESDDLSIYLPGNGLETLVKIRDAINKALEEV